MFGADHAVGRLYRIDGRKAAEHRLADFGAGRKRGAAGLRRNVVVMNVRVRVAAGQINVGAEAGLGNRDVFVYRTQIRALRLKRRVGVVSRAQCLKIVSAFAPPVVKAVASSKADRNVFFIKFTSKFRLIYSGVYYKLFLFCNDKS